MTLCSDPTLKRPSAARRRLLLAAPAALCLAACSAPGLPPPAAKPVAIERPGKATVEVSDENGGARIVLERGQTLVVALQVPGNQSPEWSLVDAPPGAFAVAGPRFERTLRDRNLDDAAGSTVWRLRADAPGEHGLRFELRRPRSTLPPLQTVTYAVTVR